MKLVQTRNRFKRLVAVFTVILAFHLSLMATGAHVFAGSMGLAIMSA
jgi:hypothetical protein